MTQIKTEHFDSLFVCFVTQFVSDFSFDGRLKKSLPRVFAGIFNDFRENAVSIYKLIENYVKTSGVGAVYSDFQKVFAFAAEDCQNTVARNFRYGFGILIIIAINGVVFFVARRNHGSETVNGVFYLFANFRIVRNGLRDYVGSTRNSIFNGFNALFLGNIR